jgi:hypothetical protein
VTPEERAFGIEGQVWNDVSKTLRRFGVNHRSHFQFEELVEALTQDAMHQVEKLLVQAEWTQP